VLDHPWVRLLLGVLAAAALGALAARVALEVPVGDGAGATGTAAYSSGGGGSGGGSEGSGGSGSSGSSGSGGTGSGGSGSRSGSGPGSGDAAAGSAGSSSGVSATVGGGSGTVTVHVTGAVRRPGVYELPEGARVFEAVKKAGGAKKGADRQRLNLAAPVRDGQQVLVPERAPVAAAAGAGGAGAAATGGTAAGAAGTGAGAAPVDLNTATLEELQTLDGVGPTTAEKILKLREERGGLGGVDDLDEVPGIGEKKLEALRAQLEP
jgi:competence protein ComEA